MRCIKYSLLIFSFITVIGCGGSADEPDTPSEPPISSVCPNDRPCAIMAFGDGIVEGPEAVGTVDYANNGGFRPALLDMAVADGKSIVFVGARQSGPASVEHPAANVRRHSGFSSMSLEDLAQMVPAPMMHFPSDIVLIHAGSFDAAIADLSSISPQSFAEPMRHLRSILQGFYTLNPNGLIVVSNFTGIDRRSVRSVAINAAIEQAVTDFQQQNSAAKIALADHFQGAIPRGHDDLLPTTAGYQAIAEVWFQAIQPYLK